MNEPAARDLASRIADTWPGGQPESAWAEELAHLDEGTAGAAYVRLRRTLDRAPTIARFLVEYRQLHTTSTAPPAHSACSACGGSGWVDCSDDRRHRPRCDRRDDCGCTAVAPCGCAAGRDARDVHQRIAAVNRWLDDEVA